MTRKSGFNASAPVRIREDAAEAFIAGPAKPLVLELALPAIAAGEWYGFGGYLMTEVWPYVQLTGIPDKPFTVTGTGPGIWAKFGTLLRATEDMPARPIKVTITPPGEGPIALYGFQAGLVEHPHLVNSRPELLENMHNFAPEANFYSSASTAVITSTNKRLRPGEASMWLKSCNRCGRYLPVNLEDERKGLSFSNHCIARSPCIHSGFGRIPSDDNPDEVFELTYGFQLECRFCKKFEVNAALNPQRTASQMKEDGARRRHFELLLEHLYQGSPQLRYKNLNGTDLARDVWERFDRRCFKCDKSLAEREMNLDHTRPLAMLWPLDEHATSLCKDCNGDKRDRPPTEFYSKTELGALAKITGLPVSDLLDPHPNIEALELLAANLDWFYDEFLKLPELQKIRDGKRTGDLVVKALNRVLDRCQDPKPMKHLKLKR